MIEEAVSAGSYRVPYAPGKDFPKIQIITIAELFAGRKIDIPLWSEPYYKEARKAEIESKAAQEGFSFMPTVSPRTPKKRKRNG